MSSYYNQGIQVVIANRNVPIPGIQKVSLIPFIQDAYDKGLLNFTVLPPGSINLTEIQNINSNRLLGRYSAGSGSIEEIKLGTGLSFTGDTLNAIAGGNNNDIQFNDAGILNGHQKFKINSAAGRMYLGYDQTGSAIFNIYTDTTLNTSTSMSIHNSSYKLFEVRDDGYSVFRNTLAVKHSSYSGELQFFLSGTNIYNIVTSGIGTLFTAGPTNRITTTQAFNALQTLHVTTNNLTQNSLIYIDNTLSYGLAQNSNKMCLDIRPTISNTVDFTSKYYGIKYDPFIVNLNNTKHIAIETTSGNVILGSTSGSTGIGPNENINKNAILDVTSSNKGFLPPRMTNSEISAVSWDSGDAGMIVFNTTTQKHQGWDGANWNNFY